MTTTQVEFEILVTKLCFCLTQLVIVIRIASHGKVEHRLKICKVAFHCPHVHVVGCVSLFFVINYDHLCLDRVEN